MRRVAALMLLLALLLVGCGGIGPRGNSFDGEYISDAEIRNEIAASNEESGYRGSGTATTTDPGSSNDCLVNQWSFETTADMGGSRICGYCASMGTGSVHWVKLELELSDFRSEQYEDVQSRVAESGITLSSLTEEGDTRSNRRRLYELNAECSADIPERGQFHSWDEYQQVRLQSPPFDPAGVVLATEGDLWVGMSAMGHRDGFDYAFADMTGTVASHRGRGIATTMKVAGIEFARTLGVSSIRTVHHPENTTIINLNRRLGYQDGDWDYPIR